METSTNLVFWHFYLAKLATLVNCGLCKCREKANSTVCKQSISVGFSCPWFTYTLSPTLSSSCILAQVHVFSSRVLSQNTKRRLFYALLIAKIYSSQKKKRLYVFSLFPPFHHHHHKSSSGDHLLSACCVPDCGGTECTFRGNCGAISPFGKIPMGYRTELSKEVCLVEHGT